MRRRTFLGILTLGPASLPAWPRIERRGAVFPLVGPYSYALRKTYPLVDRYLNAVDIGHAELAETLLAHFGREDRAVHLIEHAAFEKVRQMFRDLRKAPRLAPAEETVAPESIKTAWWLNKAFDWGHILHRQVYDILATGLPIAAKKRFIREAYGWYKSEPQLVFPGALKTHDLMEHQWFSQYWRQRYPRFNGAIWAYHWYQLRLNEVMLEPGRAAQAAAVVEVSAEFRAMFEDPELLPRHMPMAHTNAPRFRAEFPEVANTFDNLHMFHDIYNDILAHPRITDKRAEVYRQLAAFLEPQQALETAPVNPLPAGLSREEYRQLNQLTHLEHMAMMVMTTEEQLSFFRQPARSRAAVLEKFWPEMARHWPNLDKKHSQTGHGQHAVHPRE